MAALQWRPVVVSHCRREELKRLLTVLFSLQNGKEGFSYGRSIPGEQALNRVSNSDQRRALELLGYQLVVRARERGQVGLWVTFRRAKQALYYRYLLT